MDNIKVLFVSQEITPYLPETKMSSIARNLPQGIQERGKEIRTFMPRYGCVNERRNQLHEVIRLSGMNLIINDNDHPLIIKVASIQAARMQVYFIDNEDYFQRKRIVTDADGNDFDDNDERSIFFAKGVLETVKKLRWSPDIVHCHGWFTGMVPFYLKTAYKEDPMFENCKVVYSVYDNAFSKPFPDNFKAKAMVAGVDDSDFANYDPSFTGFSKTVIDHSDAIIQGSQTINSDIQSYISQTGKDFLSFHDEETYIDAYSEFYDKIIG